MKARTRDAVADSVRFVQANFADNPDAARAFVDVARRHAALRTAGAGTGTERAAAHALVLAADAAAAELASCEGGAS